jgi:hypothetical protein
LGLSARIRVSLAAVVLAVAYYFLLVFIIGWLHATHWPVWWFGAIPSRHIAAVTWVVSLHTIAVLCAAFPVAVAAVLITRDKAVQLGAVIGVLATALAIAPSLSPAVWPIIWHSQPVFFITDHIKIAAAVPLLAWVLRRASSNNRFERSRGVSSMSEGGSR